MGHQAIISGWGRYPIVAAQEQIVRHLSDINHSLSIRGPALARGLGRSYGDTSLADRVLDMTHMDHFLSFDDKTGLLCCEAGVSLDAILSVFLSRGWFLPVTPGTRYVTLGGAIACDVHGKNHHVAGSFSDHVHSLTLMLPDGSVKTCSSKRNIRLFRATCGGNGLTGVILRASIQLKPVTSAWIRQIAVKAANLTELTELFETYRDATYSVAWIDCVSRGNALGRGILLAGEHADAGDLPEGTPPFSRKPRFTIGVPLSLPSFTLNPWTVKAFNALYYGRIRQQVTESFATVHSFFYPLDGIRQWNRIYGRRGFVQYQFVIPEEAGLQPLRSIVKEIASAGTGSFLAVLKAFGRGNDNDLSFPMAGWTLALDFPASNAVFRLLDRLDSRVLDAGGRLYLTKDSRMKPETMRRGYPELDRFLSLKSSIDPASRLRSMQSTRLGVTP